uniref:F-box domain-containing protein n=1 Tax=Mycena chlorophos TaxID=658473 RepID=A0ABQ0L2S3_MYCCL|nr:predicted protein [Mycena chlorophos]
MSSDVLPPEVLCLVFEHCLPVTPLSFSAAEAPLLLLRISHRWRNICLGTPSLWTDVAFGENGAPQLLEMWLSLSALHPLSIRFWTNDESRATALLQVAVRHRERWKNASLLTPDIATQFLKGKERDFPNLQHIELFGFTGLQRRVIALDVPALTSVHLLRHHLHHPSHHHYLLPWTQLTDLRVSEQARPLTSVAYLHACPNLLHLVHDSPLMDALLVTENPDPLRHEALQSLSTQNEWLLPHLTLPSLKRLELRPAGGVVENISTDNFLPAFLARSACELTSLCLSVNTMGQAAFARILGADATQSVEHLTLAFPNPFDDYLRMLKPSENFLPMLQYLEIEDWMGAGGDHYLALLDLLRSRATAGLRGCKLFLYPRRWQLGPYPARVPSPTVMDVFNELADAGLGIHVETRELLAGEKAPRNIILIDRFPQQLRLHNRELFSS